MSPLPSFFLPQHDEVAFHILRGVPPNRICFATTHRNALRNNTGAFAAKEPFKFSLPFPHGVQQEFFRCTGIQLRKSEHGLWTGLSSDQADAVRAWMQRQGTRTYLKDFFDCSLALGERTVGNEETELGSLFTAAKYHDNVDAKREILARLKATWGDMESLPTEGYVSAPPPRPGKVSDLPTALAERLATYAGLVYLPLGTWKGDKGQLKDVPADKKWKALQQVGFEVNPTIIKSGKSVLLIDDIYQSGTTLNFLRSTLTGNGVARASAMTVVKAARDTDNQ